MKLILHVGMGKTGTTALQSFMHNERALLRRAGILSTGIRLDRLRPGFALANQGDISDPVLLRRGLDELAQAARRAKGIDRIIWSNEAMAMSRKSAEVIDTLSAFLREDPTFDEVEVVLVVRRQEEWIESAYRQWGLKQKTGRGHRIASPETYLEGMRGFLDYHALYSRWTALERAQVRLIPYDDLTAAGGIVRLFCNEAGIAWSARFDRYDAVHGSLGPSLSQFAATYNRGLAEPENSRPVLELIRAYDLPELSKPNTAFYPTPVRRALREEYRASNRALAALALGRKELFPHRPIKRLLPYETAVEDTLTYLTMLEVARHQRGFRPWHASKAAVRRLFRRG